MLISCPFCQGRQKVAEICMGGMGFCSYNPNLCSSPGSMGFYEVCPGIRHRVAVLGCATQDYLVDWLVLGDSQVLCQGHMQVLLAASRQLGFRTNLEKSDLTPSQQFCFLGFAFDTVRFTVAPVQRRIDRLLSSLAALSASSHATARQLTALFWICLSPWLRWFLWGVCTGGHFSGVSGTGGAPSPFHGTIGWSWASGGQQRFVGGTMQLGRFREFQFPFPLLRPTFSRMPRCRAGEPFSTRRCPSVCGSQLSSAFTSTCWRWKQFVWLFWLSSRLSGDLMFSFEPTTRWYLLPQQAGGSAVALSLLGGEGILLWIVISAQHGLGCLMCWQTV